MSTKNKLRSLPAVAAGLSLALLLQLWSSTSPPRSARMHILTISGQQIEGFFTDLKPNARIAKQLYA